jgi:hypothetical protein
MEMLLKKEIGTGRAKGKGYKTLSRFLVTLLREVLGRRSLSTQAVRQLPLP